MTTINNNLDRWLELRAWVEGASGQEAPARLVVEATVPEGGHIEAHEPPEPFLIPTVLEVSTDEGVTAGPVEYPQPEERRFEWSPAVLQVLAGKVRFEVPLRVDPRKQQSRRHVTAHLKYQGCIDGACLPPNAQSVTVTELQ